MSNRKLQTFDEYRYGPRSVLKPGDRSASAAVQSMSPTTALNIPSPSAASSSSAATACKVPRSGWKRTRPMAAARSRSGSASPAAARPCPT